MKVFLKRRLSRCPYEKKTFEHSADECESSRLYYYVEYGVCLVIVVRKRIFLVEVSKLVRKRLCFGEIVSFIGEK